MKSEESKGFNAFTISIERVYSDAIRPNLISEGDFWGADERPQFSTKCPELTKELYWSFHKRTWKLSKADNLIQRTLLLWAPNYDPERVRNTIIEPRLFSDADISWFLENLESDIRSTALGLFSRIRLAKLALSVPGNPCEHAFDFSWQFFDLICLLYDQLDPLLSWKSMDRDKVLLYRLLLDASYKIHRLFSGMPVDLPEAPDDYYGPSLPDKPRALLPELPEPLEPREFLLVITQIAEGMESIFNKLIEIPSSRTESLQNSEAVPEPSVIPVLNDTVFMVLLAVFRSKRPVNRRTIWNSCRELGGLIEEKTVSDILSSKLKPLNFVTLGQSKTWSPTKEGRDFVENDQRYRDGFHQE